MPAIELPSIGRAAEDKYTPNGRASGIELRFQ